MNVKRNIQLTNDAMTNIKIMIPMLNEEQRKAVSYVMFGCFIGEEISENKRNLQKATKVEFQQSNSIKN